jgi:hypothetical protein
VTARNDLVPLSRTLERGTVGQSYQTLTLKGFEAVPHGWDKQTEVGQAKERTGHMGQVGQSGTSGTDTVGLIAAFIRTRRTAGRGDLLGQSRTALSRVLVLL